MQKKLLTKTLIIVGVLLVFLYGIFGIPQSVSGEGFKEAILNRIHLGLDLKGGVHLILQVMVNDAVNAETDRAIETLKDEFSKAKVPFTDISKPDPENHPERVVVKGVPIDSGSQVRSIANDKLRDFDTVGGPDNTWVISMKPTAVNDLKTRTVDQSIEAIRTRVDSLGVSEPVIQQNGLGDNQILVQLPGVDDPGRVKDILQSTARLELREALDHGTPYPNEAAALREHGNLLPPNTILLHGK